MGLTAVQWLLGGSAAVLVGFSKTGVPGIGILVVPLLAAVFGGRSSVGVMLPLLLFGDVFAVSWYRRHAQWDRLWGLLPWVAGGLVAGTVVLILLGNDKATKDAMNPVIGVLVLLMLAVHLARLRWGDRLTPHSRAGQVLTGGSAGFTTTISNAAGPIMTIYLTSMGMPKKEFIGTQAWFFFLVNAAKLPVFYLVSRLTPSKPLVTPYLLLWDVCVFPLVLLGVLTGKWMLPRIPQKAFDTVVLALAGLAALNLLRG